MGEGAPNLEARRPAVARLPFQLTVATQLCENPCMRTKTPLASLVRAAVRIRFMALIGCGLEASGSESGLLPNMPFTPIPPNDIEVNPRALPNLTPDAISPDAIPPGSQVPLPGASESSGSNFIKMWSFGPAYGPTPFSGVITQIIWREAATGNLDFIFQIVLTTLAPPTVDIEELDGWFGGYHGRIETLVGYNGQLSLEGITAGQPLFGVPELPPGFNTAGDRPLASVQRYGSNDGVLGLDFTSQAYGDYRLRPTHPASKWIVVATNAKVYKVTDASVRDAGFAPAQMYGPAEFEITSIGRLPNGNVTLQGFAVPGTRIESSPIASPGSYTTLGTVVPDASGAFQFEDVTAAGVEQRFYRLAIEQ